MNRRNLLWFALLLCAVAFAAGVAQLIKLRFETGDVYPPYSTLRTDPLGASAFYESLEKTPDISVSRDFRPTDEMPEGRDIAYLQLAGYRGEWRELPEESFREMETFVKAGGRLVIALFPEPAQSVLSPFATNNAAEDKHEKPDGKNQARQKPEIKHGKSPRKKRRPGVESGEEEQLVSLSDRWGVGFKMKRLNRGDDDVYEPVVVVNTNEPALPESLAWHSGVVMTNLSGAWRVIYSRGSDAVLAERRWGHGAVIFSTDSYFLSNEAMRKDRHAELLAWLVGPCRQVMFDEAHFGILENPGIAALLRKYQLHGLVAGLLLLAGLFIWKNMAGFGPARETETTGAWVAGKDSASGFVNLLRHHIKPGDLLPTCVAEWIKSQPRGKFSAARIERVEAFMRSDSAAPSRGHPVRDYQTICVLLKQSHESPVPNPESKVSPQKI